MYTIKIAKNVLNFRTCNSDSFSKSVFLNLEFIDLTSFSLDSNSETLESLLVFDMGLNVALILLSMEPPGFLLSSTIFGTKTSQSVAVVQNITKTPMMRNMASWWSTRTRATAAPQMHMMATL